MTCLPFSVRRETPADCTAIDTLHALSFGPGRFARAAFRVREGIAHDPGTSFVATLGGEMIGSVRLTPVLIGTCGAMLLGPLAVSPQYKSRGAGRKLMIEAMQACSGLDVDFVLLVGDQPYYGPFGFVRAPAGSIRFPAPVDPARVLVADLRSNDGRTGCIGMPEGLVVARPSGTDDAGTFRVGAR